MFKRQLRIHSKNSSICKEGVVIHVKEMSDDIVQRLSGWGKRRRTAAGSATEKYNIA